MFECLSVCVRACMPACVCVSVSTMSANVGSHFIFSCTASLTSVTVMEDLDLIF